jgi:serine phosphatase RsbU (regulator of sigma subunit)
MTNQPQDLHSQAKQAETQGDWQAAADFYAQAFNQRAAEISLINSVQEGLSSNLEMQAIYDLVGDKLRDTFNAQIVMISQYDPLTDMVYHHYAIERGRHLSIQGWQMIDATRLKIVRTRRPVMLSLDEILELLQTIKMKVVPGTELPRSWLGVPMLVGDQVRGIVSLQNLDQENVFSQSDIDLLTTLTNSMSLSLENARLFNETQRLLNVLEQEMELARHTQQSILPSKLPILPGYDFGSLMNPARAVGGDFYDFIHVAQNKWCIVIGDVSDKGLPAALFMALTYSLVRAETDMLVDPHQVLLNVNHHLLNMNASGMFVTLVYSILDYKTGILKYARAGHLPPIILDNKGEFVDVIWDQGQPLGLFEDVKIDLQHYIIPRGGLALLYSDGLSEVSDPSGMEFGLDRLKPELVSHRKERASTICENLWNAVQKHSGENMHQDDFTTIIVKRGE